MKLPLEADRRNFALTPWRALVKRCFDLVVGLLLSSVVIPVTLVLIVCARYSTGESGLFRQERIGLYGENFTLYKIRTMRTSTNVNTHVTAADDPRITRFGRFLRRTKLDEFPQLYNVFRGDTESYLKLDMASVRILCVRPGITGPASIAFKNEELTLKDVDNPEYHNREVIFPAKIKLNLAYVDNHSLWTDIAIMFRTVF